MFEDGVEAEGVVLALVEGLKDVDELAFTEAVEVDDDGIQLRDHVVFSLVAQRSAFHAHLRRPFLEALTAQIRATQRKSYAFGIGLPLARGDKNECTQKTDALTFVRAVARWCYLTGVYTCPPMPFPPRHLLTFPPTAGTRAQKARLPYLAEARPGSPRHLKPANSPFACKS